MNVAMSRQRSLLIAVGDRAMAEGIGDQGSAGPECLPSALPGAHGHVC
jgi:hypothetical protein